MWGTTVNTAYRLRLLHYYYYRVVVIVNVIMARGPICRIFFSTCCVTSRSMTPRGRGDLGLNPQLKHAVINCSQTVSLVLPPGEYKRGVG